MNVMKKQFSIFAVAAVCLLSACSSDDPIAPEKPSWNPIPGNTQPGDSDKDITQVRKIKLSEDGAKFVNNQNTFSIKLMEQMGDENENVFMSPMCIYSSLSLLANGAGGDTRSQILDALGYKSDEIEILNTMNQKFINALPIIDESVTFSFANSLWISKEFHVFSSYANLAKADYNAEIKTVDFKSPTTLQSINSWCNEKTNGMIPVLLNEIDAETKFALFYATYFNGAWSKKFDKENTQKMVFQNHSGSISMVNMMTIDKWDYEYLENDNFSALRMPVGYGGYDVCFVLPKHDGNISYEEAFNVSAYSNELCEIFIPRFEINYNVYSEIRNALNKMGIIELFTDYPEMDNLSEDPMKISEMFQKSVIKVDEDGAKAASAGGTIWVTGEPSANPQKVIFKLNRPFKFFIQEKSSGAVLFMGKVNKL